MTSQAQNASFVSDFDAAYVSSFCAYSKAHDSEYLCSVTTNYSAFAAAGKHTPFTNIVVARSRLKLTMNHHSFIDMRIPCHISRGGGSVLEEKMHGGIGSVLHEQICPSIVLHPRQHELLDTDRRGVCSSRVMTHVDELLTAFARVRGREQSGQA